MTNDQKAQKSKASKNTLLKNARKSVVVINETLKYPELRQEAMDNLKETCKKLEIEL